jgi:hypothetical protein
MDRSSSTINKEVRSSWDSTSGRRMNKNIQKACTLLTFGYKFAELQIGLSHSANRMNHLPTRVILARQVALRHTAPLSSLHFFTLPVRSLVLFGAMRYFLTLRTALLATSQTSGQSWILVSLDSLHVNGVREPFLVRNK